MQLVWQELGHNQHDLLTTSNIYSPHTIPYNSGCRWGTIRGTLKDNIYKLISCARTTLEGRCKVEPRLLGARLINKQ